MNVIWLLLRASVFNVAIAVFTGLVSGSCSARLIALINDAISGKSTFVIPFICIDIAIIAGCLVYLGWLSIPVFLLVILFLVVAIGTIQVLLNQARKFLSFAREEDDKLFKHFRTITDGVKELKLHTARRQEFFNSELQVSAAASCQHNIAALNTFAIAIGWGNLLFLQLSACYCLLYHKLCQFNSQFCLPIF